MVQLLSRNVYWNKSLHFREPFATVNHGDINEQYTVKKKKKKKKKKKGHVPNE